MKAQVSLVLAAAALAASPLAAQQPVRARPPVARQAPRRDARTTEPTPRRDDPAPKARDRTPDRGGRVAPDARDREQNGRSNSERFERGDRRDQRSSVGDRRFQLDRPFARGRFVRDAGRRYPIARVDFGAGRVWLSDGFGFEIAGWDWPLTSLWNWRADRFVIEADPDHLGWYLLTDLRLGRSVHVLFLGA
jgi:Ni/Co efflux regulator RcnB